MEWLKRMNMVLDYIESNLSAHIENEEIGRISSCPVGLFQRIFARITDIPLSEYIRRRKLTIAAFELKTTDIKIIDVALKFGYESTDAFSVAFKRMHGINPAMARQNGVELKSYPRLTFNISIKGAEEMKYRIEEKEGFKVTGKSIVALPADDRIRQFWCECIQDGTIDSLCKIGLWKSAGGMLGVCYDMQDNGKFSYMIGVESISVPDGMKSIDIPKSTWAIFEAEGPMPDVIKELWQRIFSEFLPQSAYKHACTVDLEVYFERDKSSPNCKCEVWIPVKKKD